MLATGSQPDQIPACQGRQPARDGLDRRARPARHPEDPAGRRRRLHRPRARVGLRRARHQGHGRRDDADGLLPGADRDLVDVLGQAHRQDVRQGDAAQHQGRRHDGRQEGRHGDLRGRGGRRRSETFDRVLVSIGRRPNSQDPRPRQDQRQGRRAASSRSTSSAAPPSRRSSPSATWPASRCWRTRRRTRRASPSRRSPARRSAFEPPAIPAVVFTDPEIAWAGLTEAEAEKQGRKVEVAQVPVGARPAAPSPSTAPTA